MPTDQGIVKPFVLQAAARTSTGAEFELELFPSAQEGEAPPHLVGEVKNAGRLSLLDLLCSGLDMAGQSDSQLSGKIPCLHVPHMSAEIESLKRQGNLAPVRVSIKTTPYLEFVQEFASDERPWPNGLGSTRLTKVKLQVTEGQNQSAAITLELSGSHKCNEDVAWVQHEYKWPQRPTGLECLCPAPNGGNDQVNAAAIKAIIALSAGGASVVAVVALIMKCTGNPRLVAEALPKVTQAISSLNPQTPEAVDATTKGLVELMREGVVWVRISNRLNRIADLLAKLMKVKQE
jgi:hypothetical protein